MKPTTKGMTPSNEQWLADWQARDNELKGSGDKMNINEVYTSGGTFLRADDLQGNTIKLRIVDVGSHVFNAGQPDEKVQVVLSFDGKDKKLGLNVTNAKALAAQLGPETDDWTGKEIKLFPTITDFDGKEVACIRIVQEAPPEASSDDIPF